MGLEQGGSPCAPQPLVSNFLSHFVKWTCEPRIQARIAEANTPWPDCRVLLNSALLGFSSQFSCEVPASPFHQ